MDWANGRLIKCLIDQNIGVSAVAIFADISKRNSYNFEIKVSKIYSLPFPFSYKGAILNFFSFRRILKQIAADNDILIVQLPFIGFISLLTVKSPTIFHVCANVLTAARNPFKYAGMKLIASKFFAFFMHVIFRRLFKRNNSKLIVNGNELGDLYRIFDPIVTVSSSVKLSEIVSLNDISYRSNSSDFSILFIGRPSKEKGFHTLLNAYIRLVDSGNNVSLSLVGLSRQDLLDMIDFRIEEKYFETIQFYGFIPWGVEFKRIVNESHCLALCSVSEGTPRVLIEARALGCPVVATRVGGITTSVKDKIDGVLFEPEDVTGLVKSIQMLFDENFRQMLITNGLETVKHHTLEKFSNTFIEAINGIVNHES